LIGKQIFHGTGIGAIVSAVSCFACGGNPQASL